MAGKRRGKRRVDAPTDTVLPQILILLGMGAFSGAALACLVIGVIAGYYGYAAVALVLWMGSIAGMVGVIWEVG